MKSSICQVMFGAAATLLLVPSLPLLSSLAHSTSAGLPQTLASGGVSEGQIKILTDRALLEKAGIDAIAVEPLTQVAYAIVTPEQQEAIGHLSHERGSCAGFEVLSAEDGVGMMSVQNAFSALAGQKLKNDRYQAQEIKALSINPLIQSAVGLVDPEELKSTVALLSSFPTRDHRKADGGLAIEALKEKIQKMLQSSALPYSVESITHKSTKQKSLLVRLEGKSRPDEIIVLGGHVDSINHSWFGKKDAPGADDNASGSANLVEALRILSALPQNERSIEFYWYAGEEGGLLGSSEIATRYRGANKDVIAALQLDMTLFPGDGELVIGSMTDFTSAWLRGHFTRLNELYLGLKVIDGECGYGCSDHASWHRQGYPTLMTSEATYRRMNRNLHTKNDVIDNQSNFAHSAAFTKIALALAMDLGNSMEREPSQ